MDPSGGILFHDADEPNWSASLFEGSPDAQMIPTKDSSANHDDSGCGQLGQAAQLLSFDCSKAAGIEFEQMADLVFRLWAAPGNKAGCRGGGTANASSDSDELQEI
jgi:hypothetical protein